MANSIKTLGALLRRWLASANELEQQRQGDQQLRLSEERLRLATEAGKVGVWDWDVVANRISWTGSLYAIHGVQPGDFDGTAEGFAALTHPDDRDAVQRAIERALTGDQPYEIEFRAVRPDGETIWLYTSASVIRQRGRPVRMVGATVDINARKRTELALRESEERFAKAFNASPLSLTISSLKTGKLLEVNETFVNVSGFARGEAIGRTTVELGLWVSAQDRESEMNAVRAAGRVRNLVCRFRTRRGEERIGLLSAEKILIGEELHALTVIQDITEREQAQAASRESEQRLRLALQAASAGVWEVNVATGKTFWSDEFQSLYGYTSSTARSYATWIASIHPEDRQSVDADFQRRLTSGRSEFRQEFRIIHPTRGVRWILDLSRIMRDANGEAVSFSGINLDITRLKHIEEELREADQRKNEFLATLAHELRNPLAPIRNGLEILRLTQSGGDIAERARSMMDRQLQQMVRLIDDLLDLSRISRGKIELRRAPIDLMTALQSALETSEPLIESAGHELSVDVPAGPLMVDGDLARLSQVFANLLNNAAKYTNPGGHIWLTVRRTDEQVSVTIRDNGIGIPTHMLPKIFEMFAQVDHSLEKAQGGLGIGLSIARKLVEMHGGVIEAHSDGHGAGSEFVVRLPAHLATQSETTTPVPKDHSLRPDALRVLIADDNADAAASLAMMLKMKGHEVRTAWDGLEAVQVAEAFQPDVALLDIGMPELNGYDACRRLRARSESAGMLIIALTGWGQEEDKRRSEEAGFDHHLVKPADVRILDKLLEQAEVQRAIVHNDS
ncbi:MAG: PAS domain S-box protein [Steroidobacter sp.]